MLSRTPSALDSTQSAQRPAPFRLFSQLPFELVRQIIESCIPLNYHSTTYKARQNTLGSLCLVSRLFHEIAKPLLEAVVLIDSSETFQSWQRECRSATAGYNVRHFVLPSDRSLGPVDLQPVFQSQLQLTTLVLDHLRETLELANLGLLTNLVRLSISLTAISISRPFTLPLLLEMSWVYLLRFSNVALDDRSLKAAFPSLRAFTLHGDVPPVFDTHLLDSILEALSQQVDVIHARIDTLRSHPSIFAALKEKTLFDICDDYSLTKFRARPVNGRLVHDPDDEDDVEYLPEFVSALGADPDLSQLSLLYLPPILSEENVSNSADDSARQDLLNLCRDRKIEVVFEENTGRPDEDSIVSPDFWRRRRELRKGEKVQ